MGLQSCSLLLVLFQKFLEKKILFYDKLYVNTSPEVWIFIIFSANFWIIPRNVRILVIVYGVKDIILEWEGCQFQPYWGLVTRLRWHSSQKLYKDVVVNICFEAAPQQRNSSLLRGRYVKTKKIIAKENWYVSLLLPKIHLGHTYCLKRTSTFIWCKN